MKVASVVFKERDFNNIFNYSDVISMVKAIMREAFEKKVDLIVFPALIGCLRGKWKDYVEDILRISLRFRDIYICPGSYYEDRENKTYHSSCIVKNGRILMRQRQLYLARWEKSIELSRGNKLETVYINNLKTAIILSTDAFYPEVSHYAAANGVNLTLSPMAIRGTETFPLQLSSVWNNVQNNQFLAVESGFKGEGFFSYSAVHSPIGYTDKNKDLLILERENETERILVYDLDETKNLEIIKRIDAIPKLNRHIYMNMTR